jgi:hypothetical protein
MYAVSDFASPERSDCGCYLLAPLADTSYELFGGMAPLKVAQIEFDLWPADDGNSAPVGDDADRAVEVVRSCANRLSVTS